MSRFPRFKVGDTLWIIEAGERKRQREAERRITWAGVVILYVGAVAALAWYVCTIIKAGGV